MQVKVLGDWGCGGIGEVVVVWVYTWSFGKVRCGVQA